MINVSVTVTRTILFPAGLAQTIAYFRDFRRVLDDLPDIHLIQEYASDQYRILYSTGNTSVYQVEFFCDIKVQYDEPKLTLSLVPLQGFPPVKTEVSLGRLTGQGHYSSRTGFHPQGDKTKINYQVTVGAKFPKRLELSLVPDIMVEQMAVSATRKRLQEITEKFFTRSSERIKTG